MKKRNPYLSLCLAVAESLLLAGNPTAANASGVLPLVWARSYARRAVAAQPITIHITSPRFGASQTTLPNISGTVDPGTGHHLLRVTVSIRRAVDQDFWNGTTWTPTETELTTVVTGNTWTRTSALPAGSNLFANTYVIIATAFNDAAERASDTNNVFLGAQDVTPPTIHMLAPTANSISSTFPIVRGTASDNTGGSGLRDVTVTIQRSSDGAYWDGTRFVIGNRVVLPTSVTNTAGGPANLSQPINWTLAAARPPAASLTDGLYQVLARATDNQDNFIGATVFIRVDTTNPTVSITSPVTGVANSIGRITGTAVDPGEGSGIGSVFITIRRSTDAAYWTGKSFIVNPPDPKLAAAVSGNTWSYQASIPSVALDDAQYTIQATAYDRVLNPSAPDSVVLTVEHKAPTVTFTTPASDVTALSDLTTVEGQATDGFSGSGVARVDLTIRRDRDGAYWTGTAFSTAPTVLHTTFTGTGWSKTTGFSRTSLAEGSYTLQATAVDLAGNAGAATRQIIIDRTAPASVTFTAPRNGDLLGIIPTVSGAATDNSGGSGILEVDLSIQRVTDGLFWSGVSWGSQAFLKTKVTGKGLTVTWTKSTELPRGNNLIDGDYILTATALDAVGNKRSSSIRVTVNHLVGAQVASRSANTAPSRVVASVAASSIQLSFVAAQDPASVSDATAYQVTVNGHAASVTSAAYNGQTHAVTLALGEGSLHTGDTVFVSAPFGQATATAR